MLIYRKILPLYKKKKKTLKLSDFRSYESLKESQLNLGKKGCQFRQDKLVHEVA